MFSKFNRLLISIFLLLFLAIYTLFTQQSLDWVLVSILCVVCFLMVLELLNAPEKSKTIQQVPIIDSEDHLTKDNLVQSIPLPAAIIDSSLDIISQNEGFIQLVSQKTTSVKTLEFQIRQLISEAIISQRPLRKEVQINQYEYQLFANHFLTNQQRITLVIFLDITQLIESQRNQRRFIADASHELKTPITAIRAMSEILNSNHVDPEMTEEFHQQIEKESIRLQVLVNDLLSLSKLSSNRILLNYSSFDFSDLVSSVYNTLRKGFMDKSISFICEFNSLMVWFDYSRMQQILNNLIQNALNYTDKGYVKVSYVIENNNFVLKVSDTGIGIPQENLKYIFERFYRVNTARSRDEGGSGLGLSIVKELVSAHQGDLLVDSIEHEGTIFTIIIPIQEVSTQKG